MNIQIKMRTSQLLWKMNKYPDLSRDLGLIDTSKELQSEEREEDKMKIRDRPSTQDKEQALSEFYMNKKYEGDKK